MTHHPEMLQLLQRAYYIQAGNQYSLAESLAQTSEQLPPAAACKQYVTHINSVVLQT